MVKRVFTKVFLTKALRDLCRQEGIGIKQGGYSQGLLEYLVSNMNEDAITNLIQCGNPNMTKDEAFEVYDNYLKEDVDHNLLSAWIQILEEFDKDTHLSKMLNLSPTFFRDLIEKSKPEELITAESFLDSVKKADSEVGVDVSEGTDVDANKSAVLE